MPTDISNTLGTARQFTPQPDAQYQGRYQGVGAGTAAVRATNGLDTLAANMERLNAAFQGYAVSHEKYLESTGADAANQMINPMSEADIKKLDVMDAAQQEGFVDSTDNPYFLAHASKLRGSFLAARAKQEYDEKYSMTPARSMDEEQKRYSEFISDWRQANVTGDKAPTMPAAFDKGFDENQLVNMTNLANDWYKKKHEEDIMVTMASTQSKLGDIIENSVELLKTNGAMTQAVQSAFNEVRLMGLPAQYRLKLLDDFATQIIQTGHLDSTRLSQMMDNITIQSSLDGTTTKASDLLDMQTYKTYAAAFNRQFTTKWNEDTRKSFVDKKDKNGLLMWGEWTRQNDPDKALEVEQQVRQGMGEIDQKIREEKAEARQRLAARMSQGKANDKLQNTAGAISTWINGGTMYNGQTISSLSIDKDTLNQVITPILTQLQTNGDVDKVTRLMSMPQLSSLRGDIAADITYKLDNIRPSSDGGTPQLDDTTRSLLNFYIQNSNSVEHMFGSEVGNRAKILKSLFDLHNGNMDATLSDFAAYNTADSDIKKGYREQVGKLLASTWYTAEGVPHLGVDGDIDSGVSIPIYSNPEMQSAVTNLATVFCVQGLSVYDAVNKAGSVISNNFMSYHDGVFPKGVYMDSIPDVDEYNNRVYFIRSLNDAMYSATDGEASYATLRYDRTAQKFFITDDRTGKSSSYSLGYIRQAARERWEHDLEWKQNNPDVDTTVSKNYDINSINSRRSEMTDGDAIQEKIANKFNSIW